MISASYFYHLFGVSVFRSVYMPSQALRVRSYPMLSFVFQMLCEEESVILDIPESIKKSGLTILKGIMETRNDKLWAKFVVEVCIDDVELSIFCSVFF